MLAVFTIGHCAWRHVGDCVRGTGSVRGLRGFGLSGRGQCRVAAFGLSGLREL